MNQSDTDILTLVDPDTFWNSVEVGDPFACWPWLDTVNNNGYGTVMVRVDDRIRGFMAHRVAYLLANDDTLGDYIVCHHCDNPPCCNPRCLFKGTDEDNQWDRVVKSNERKIIAGFRERIQEDYLSGIDAYNLCKKYGVTSTYIKLITKSAPLERLIDVRLRRQAREREQAGLPPLRRDTAVVPPALALIEAAFLAYKNPKTIPSRLVLDYANRGEGIEWTVWNLASTLRQECAALGTAPPETRDARSDLSNGRTIKHYFRADVLKILGML